MRERRICGRLHHDQTGRGAHLSRTRQARNPISSNSENRARASALALPLVVFSRAQVQNDDVHTPRV